MIGSCTDADLQDALPTVTRELSDRMNARFDGIPVALYGFEPLLRLGRAVTDDVRRRAAWLRLPIGGDPIVQFLLVRSRSHRLTVCAEGLAAGKPVRIDPCGM